MDLRQLIADKLDLLVMSLSPPSKEFIYYLVEKQMAPYTTQTKHMELSSTIQQVEHLIEIVCKRPSDDFAKIFLEWLITTDQTDLHAAIVQGHQVADVDAARDFTADGVDDDGESDCESLSSGTKDYLDYQGVLPSQEYLNEKLSNSDVVYPLSKPIRGTALLVVNSKYEKKPKYDRSGSEFDIHNLHGLFKWLGYDVIVFRNLSSKKLYSELSNLVRDNRQSDYKSFVLCVLSHGGNDVITMADMTEVYVDQLLDRLDSNNFPAMAGKPKFIYLDTSNPQLSVDSGLVVPKADEGHQEVGKTGELQPIQLVKSPIVNAESSSTVRADKSSPPVIDKRQSKVACKADFVLFLSPFPRYTALHNTIIGSICTRVLVETFYKHAHRLHVVDLARKVRRKLSTKLVAKTKHVPTIVETLTKEFYMFPFLK